MVVVKRVSIMVWKSREMEYREMRSRSGRRAERWKTSSG